MRQFPQELVDLVIDQVALLNDNDVGSCGRVCRRWMSQSRKHLFSRIRIQLSRTDPATILSFLDIVDTSLVQVLSFVRSLDLAFVYVEVPEEELTLEFLPEDPFREDRLHVFPPWLLAHIRRFGACESLTDFELNFPSDIGLDVVAEIITTLPFLTHLRIRGGAYTITQTENPPVKDMFPLHLHNLDISLHRKGTGLFFQWLLSHSQVPSFTSLKLGGAATVDSMEPIEAYLSRYGSTLTTLSLSILVDDGQYTQDFEMRTLKLALRWQLRDLSLVHQRPKTVPTTLMLLSSVPLLRLEIGVVPIGAFGPPDWIRIDDIVASRFKGLQRLSFLHSWMRTPLTPEISALMPQAVARKILAHECIFPP